MKHKDGLRVKKVGISLVVVISMLISGIAILAAPVTVAQETMGGEYGGGLRVALQAEPSSLNPLAATLNEPAEQIIDLLYESLGRIDPYSLELVPWMASGWEVDAANESIVRVTLRNGIMWHDGTEVTLDDVIYSLGTPEYNLDYISSMTKDDANNTIIFNLTQPDARFFAEAMVKKIVPDGFTSASEPMGCGPYTLVSSDANSTQLMAYDDHFIARPYLDTITFTYYPYVEADFSADYPYSASLANIDDPRWDGTYRASHDLLTKQIDFIGWGLSTNQTTGMIQKSDDNTTLILDSNITVQGSNGLNSWYLGFNNAPDNVLNNVALRKAITYAINKNGLTQYDISGGLEQTESIISKYNVPWYNNSIAPYGFDMTEAGAILDSAGFMDYNGDGFREIPEASGTTGIPFNLTLLGPAQDDVTPYTMSTNIMTWLSDLGLNVSLVSDTFESHQARINSDNFDMYLADEMSGSVDPQFIYDIYYSKATNTNRLNFAGEYAVANEAHIQDLDNETWTFMLNYTDIVDPVFVYHNDSLVADTLWDLDYDTGKLTLDSTLVFDYENDTLNVNYSYLPFDHYMDMAEKQLDPADRAVYIKDAQAVIADLCPSVPMFMYKVNHAYVAGSYIGWVQTLGGIANYWTYTNLKNELVGELDISLSSFKNSLTESDSMNLYVKVQDRDGASIDTAQFVFSGEGTFGVPEYDETGHQYTVEYTAPATTVSKTLSLSVSAYAAGYTSASDDLDVTVHPTVNNFNVEIVRGNTTLASGESTSISVVVTDKTTSQAVSGATIVLSLSPIGLGGELAEITGTTDSAGEFVTEFRSDNVTVDTTFRISAYATMDGYVDAEQSTSISVARDPTITSLAQDKGFLGLPAPSFLVVMIMLAAMSMIYATYRRKE